MSKLNRALQEAEKNNLGKKGVDKTKSEAKKAVKKKAKKTAKNTAKKAAKNTHRFLSKHSKLYRKATEFAVKNANKLKVFVKLLKQGLKAFFKFLATPPVGWIVAVVLVAMIVKIVDSGAFDSAGGMGNENVTMSDDEYLLYYQNMCSIDNPNAPIDDSIGDADWTTPGTVANQNAEQVFNFWVDRGFSGAGAAAIVGWTNSEGGFEMFGRAEGHYMSSIQEASIMYNNEPIPSGNYEVGGGGVYQFTPYTKYAPLGSPDWENGTKINQFVADAIINGSWNASMDMTGDNNSFEDLARSTDPQYAVLIWMAYERADASTVNQDQKRSDAQKVYDMFNGSQYKFDESRFETHFGAASGGDGESGTHTAYVDPCARIGGQAWRGQGGQPSISSGTWMAHTLPNEMKEYALDPRSVGMQLRIKDSWKVLVSPDGTGGQCTDLSASLMYALWEKDGQHPVQKMGNGIDVAENWANAFGGSTTRTPTAGAVFSAQTSNEYGHTGVVSHVFDNGDFLIIEQNIKGYSGDSAGSPLTWSYRYISTSESSAKGYKFYDPSVAGYTLVKGITSQ